MPPVATETLTSVTENAQQALASLKLRSNDANGDATARSSETNGDGAQAANDAETPYRYQHLLPVFDPAEHYPPLEPFEHVDPGHRALTHQNPRSFLTDRNANVHVLTPAIGSEVNGVDLLSLNNRERDQLALEVARRGVVVFRNQREWFNAHADTWRSFGSYFGRLHIHPTSGHPQGYPELHLVYRAQNTSYNYERDNNLSTAVWHSDVSYEHQPPGFTAFWLLDSPETGGDTMFVSSVKVLKRFSPQFRAFLGTLKAVHSGVAQANYSRSGKRGGIVRREPVENEHPIVRRHPVTGEEALYINFQFTTHIVGLKKEESDNLLSFLHDAIAKAHDSQLRIHWAPETVVLWDNRVTSHTAIVDYTEGGERRHGARLAAQAEPPISVA